MFKAEFWLKAKVLKVTEQNLKIPSNLCRRHTLYEALRTSWKNLHLLLNELPLRNKDYYYFDYLSISSE